MSKNEESWLANYEALKAHVLETGHFPNKHDKRLNWAKFLMKIKLEHYNANANVSLRNKSA